MNNWFGLLDTRKDMVVLSIVIALFAILIVAPYVRRLVKEEIKEGEKIMNKDQRKRLDAVIEKLNDCFSEVEEIADEERDKYDNMPEGLQNSEKGERLNEIADCLDEAVQQIEEAVQGIEEAVA